MGRFDAGLHYFATREGHGHKPPRRSLIRICTDPRSGLALHFLRDEQSCPPEPHPPFRAVIEMRLYSASRELVAATPAPQHNVRAADQSVEEDCSREDQATPKTIRPSLIRRPPSWPHNPSSVISRCWIFRRNASILSQRMPASDCSVIMARNEGGTLVNKVWRDVVARGM